MHFPTSSPLKHTLLLSICLASALLLGACQSEGPNALVTISDLQDDPDQYTGQTVVVSGDIDDVYSSSFTIGGQGFGDELLVIVPDDAELSGGRTGDQPYTDDDIVQVTGTVRDYLVTDIESEFGLGLDPEIEYEEQEPTVIASSIEITPRVGADTTGADTTRADTTGADTTGTMNP